MITNHNVLICSHTRKVGGRPDEPDDLHETLLQSRSTQRRTRRHDAEIASWDQLESSKQNDQLHLSSWTQNPCQADIPERKKAYKSLEAATDTLRRPNRVAEYDNKRALSGFCSSNSVWSTGFLNAFQNLNPWSACWNACFPFVTRCCKFECCHWMLSMNAALYHHAILMLRFDAVDICCSIARGGLSCREADNHEDHQGKPSQLNSRHQIDSVEQPMYAQQAPPHWTIYGSGARHRKDVILGHRWPTPGIRL